MARFNQLNKFQKIIVYIVVAFVALFVLPFMSWLIGEEGFTATSNADFCVSCHAMKPFAKANADTAHGGNNPYGIRASCTDCHLPHDNSANYFYVKARTGLHDIFANTFYDMDKIDWKAKTEHRELFVYDSGCMSCHVELENATAGTKEHDHYFGGITDSKCVTCHEEVGHANLNEYLLENKYQK